jgi:hypothetical protein
VRKVPANNSNNADTIDQQAHFVEHSSATGIKHNTNSSADKHNPTQRQTQTATPKTDHAFYSGVTLSGVN